jgi:hypothetical protein
MMEIKAAFPPNIDQIDEVFKVKDKTGIIYAYGSVIYNPSNIFIPEFLIAHESVHCKRQGSDVEKWWEKYLTDVEFRYVEELHSHAKEFQVRAAATPRDRNNINRLLMESAARLAAPLYGQMTSVQKAAQDIKKIFFPRF